MSLVVAIVSAVAAVVSVIFAWKKITAGITDDNVYKRMGWMVVSFLIHVRPAWREDFRPIAALIDEQTRRLSDPTSLSAARLVWPLSHFRASAFPIADRAARPDRFSGLAWVGGWSGMGFIILFEGICGNLSGLTSRRPCRACGSIDVLSIRPRLGEQ